MHKLAALRQHLIASPLQIRESNLDIYATSGGIRSANGDHNQDFELQYTAHILLRNHPGDPDALAYLILRWLEQHQPDHADKPIEWEADLLDHRSADIYLAIPLSETVNPVPVDGGIELRHLDDPTIDPAYLSAAEWSLYIRNEGDEELVAEWLEGG